MICDHSTCQIASVRSQNGTVGRAEWASSKSNAGHGTKSGAGSPWLGMVLVMGRVLSERSTGLESLERPARVLPGRSEPLFPHPGHLKPCADVLGPHAWGTGQVSVPAGVGHLPSLWGESVGLPEGAIGLGEVAGRS